MKKRVWLGLAILILAGIVIWLVLRPPGVAAPVVPNMPAAETNFQREGYLVGAPGAWRLIYEEPGAPALTVDLLIGANSHCERNGEAGSCENILRIAGNRIKVEGNRSGTVLTVNKIIAL
jgi:hypothetical protein